MDLAAGVASYRLEGVFARFRRVVVSPALDSQAGDRAPKEKCRHAAFDKKWHTGNQLRIFTEGARRVDDDQDAVSLFGVVLVKLCETTLSPIGRCG